ncbi:hypothetical protein C2S52_013243 [Perilla frutescens var. hirtella]|nr:hypothetical protein C2S52_013243 [Perilla frutescens var. hirtella]
MGRKTAAVGKLPQIPATPSNCSSKKSIKKKQKSPSKINQLKSKSGIQTRSQTLKSCQKSKSQANLSSLPSSPIPQVNQPKNQQKNPTTKPPTPDHSSEFEKPLSPPEWDLLSLSPSPQRRPPMNPPRSELMKVERGRRSSASGPLPPELPEKNRYLS